MNQHIEAARAFDAEEIAVILHGWNTSTNWMPNMHSFQDTIGFANMLIGKGWVTLVRHTQVVGFLACDGKMIHALYVAPEHYNQGIGSVLLRDAQARFGKLSLWTFEKNQAAQRFYRRHGFVETARSDGAGNDEKLPDIRYEWHKREAADDTI